jgi:MFS family permease
LTTPSTTLLRSPWAILVATLVVQVVVSVANSTYSTLAPFLREDFKLSLGAVGLFHTSVYLGYMIGAIPAGSLVDRLGSLRVLVGGVVLSGVFALLIPVSGWLIGLPAVFVGLVALGMMGATPIPAGSKAVARAFPASRRGLVLGIRQTGIPLGSAIAAALLPVIAAGYGWRAASMSVAVLAVIAAGVALWLYWEPPAPSMDSNLPTVQGADTFWSVVRTPNIWLATTTGVLLPTGQFIMLTYLILFLTDRFGWSTLQGAGLLTAANLAGAFGRVFWGWVSDRFWGRRGPPLTLVLALAAASALSLAVLPKGTPGAVLVVLVLMYGACALGWQGLHFALLQDIAPRGWEGRITGFALVFTSLGSATAPPVFGLIVDHSSYAVAWLVLAVIFSLGSWRLSQVREVHIPRA